MERTFFFNLVRFLNRRKYKVTFFATIKATIALRKEFKTAKKQRALTPILEGICARLKRDASCEAWYYIRTLIANIYRKN